MQPERLIGPVILGARPIRWITAGMIASALVILWMGRYTDLDLMLTDALFDVAANAFPWRHAWLTETFNHVILKFLLVLTGLGFIGAAAIDAIRPLDRLNVRGRLQLRIVALSALLVPLVISSLKQFSTSHCPWDLSRYGGDQPYVRMLDALPAGAISGHCLPAGHASSALWLLSLAVFWLPRQPRTARSAALAALALGGTVGWLQQLRGAHFLTHTLWSIWITCAIVFVLVIVLQRQAARRGAACVTISGAPL